MKLSFEKGTGWLNEARRVPSPNFDSRPAGCEPELIVIHGISLPPGEYGGPWIDQLFTNSLNPAEHDYFAEIEGLDVSSHLLIRRNGELVQYVDLYNRAWHAGQSCYAGREACNDFAIGIELEGTDTEPYADEQYAVLIDTLSFLQESFSGLTCDRVVGHSDIAPGRKTDPGEAFDWSRVEQVAKRPVKDE